MGWKTINGRQYYYQCEREGEKVKTPYVGVGETAHLFSRMNELTCAKREHLRYFARAEREEAEAEEKDIAEWFARVEAVADAAMFAAGFHKHKRSRWRRRRDGERTGDGQAE